MPIPASDPTNLLQAVQRRGDRTVAELMPVVYHELRTLAQWMLDKEDPGHTVSATALVHDAYVRLIGGVELRCNDETHFKAIAASCIRRILVDHARAQRSQKRGGEYRRLILDSRIIGGGHEGIGLLEFEDLLNVLAADSPRIAAIVELRLYGGLTIPDAAQWLGCSSATVDRDWRFARAWLAEHLWGSPVALGAAPRV